MTEQVLTSAGFRTEVFEGAEIRCHPARTKPGQHADELRGYVNKLNGFADVSQTANLNANRSSLAVPIVGWHASKIATPFADARTNRN